MSACDLVVAAENARIGYPEVRRGLMAALVVSFLCHQIGERRARELVLLGQYIDARRAWEMGLVNRVVPAAQLHEATLALASEVLKGGPAAVERTKHLVNQIAPRHINERLEHALEHHLLTRNSDEAEEGLAAFVAKRAPSWDPDVQNGNAS